MGGLQAVRVRQGHFAANLRTYVDSFSAEAADVLEKFGFEAPISRLADVGLLRMMRIVVPAQVLQVVQQLDEEMARLDQLRDKLNQAGALTKLRQQGPITAAVTGQFDVATARGVA